MGVVRYLCITIFLVSLAVSALGVAPTPNARAAECSGSGRLGSDALTCLCESGVSGEICDEVLVCDGAAAEFADVVNDHVEHYPKLDTEFHTINFTANHLTFSVSGPLVNNRSYTDIKFVGSSDPRCALGTNESFWALSADEESCMDRLSLDMLWSNHRGCNFVLLPTNAAIEFWEFKATVLVTYADRLGQLGDEEEKFAEQIFRRSSVSFDIYVKFTKSITVEIEEVLVYSDAELNLYLIKFEWNPDTEIVTVDLITKVNWPNQIKYAEGFPITIALPENLEVVPREENGENRTDLLIVNQGCPWNEEKTDCKQYISFEIRVKEDVDDEATACHAFDGVYFLNMTMASCREESDDNTGIVGLDYAICTSKFKFPNFTITDYETCGEVSVNPTLEAELVAFPTEDRNAGEETTNFNVGAVGYFQINVKNNENAVNLTIIDLYAVPESIASDTNVDPIYIIKKYVVQERDRDGALNPNYDADEIHSVVDLKIDAEGSYTKQDMANGDAVYTPQFSFQFDGFVFRPVVGESRVYTIHIKAEIIFSGNDGKGYDLPRTRTVDFVFKPTGANLVGSIETAISAAPENVQGSSSAKSLSMSTILPVVGVALVVVVGAIVIAVVVIKKKNNQYNPLFN